MVWLDYLGIAHAEAARILAVSRRAEDDAHVQRAVIMQITDGVALVKRHGWNGERLPDYPVTVKAHG